MMQVYISNQDSLGVSLFLSFFLSLIEVSRMQ